MKLIELLNVMKSNEDIEIYDRVHGILFVGEVDICIYKNSEIHERIVELAESVVYRDGTNHIEIRVEDD